jgi:hypothetical protein
MQGCIIKDIDVSDDYLTLSEVLDSAALSPKWLAAAVGRSLKTVYRYLSGEATIPSVVWRVLYDKTRDTRITAMITGAVPVVVVDLLDNEPDGIPALAELVRMRGRQIEAEKEMLDILADGIVDDHDRDSLRRLRTAYREMIRTQSQVFYAIEHQYERSRI